MIILPNIFFEKMCVIAVREIENSLILHEESPNPVIFEFPEGLMKEYTPCLKCAEQLALCLWTPPVM